MKAARLPRVAACAASVHNPQRQYYGKYTLEAPSRNAHGVPREGVSSESAFSTQTVAGMPASEHGTHAQETGRSSIWRITPLGRQRRWQVCCYAQKAPLQHAVRARRGRFVRHTALRHAIQDCVMKAAVTRPPPQVVSRESLFNQRIRHAVKPKVFGEVVGGEGSAWLYMKQRNRRPPRISY